MNKFHYCCEPDVGVFDATQCLGGQQHQQRAHALTAGIDDVMADVFDHFHIRL